MGHTEVIDDHLMPSGEPGPAPSRHDRTLESLGGSSRLELGLGGVARVLRRRGLLLLLIFAVAFVAIYAVSSQLPKRYSSVAWIKITDQSQNLFDKAGSSVDVTKEQKAVVLTLESPRLSAALQKKLGPQFKDVKSVLATGLEASPLIRVDSSATSPRIAERAAQAAAEFAVADRQEKVQAKLAADATKLDAEINDPHERPRREAQRVSGAIAPLRRVLARSTRTGRAAGRAGPVADRDAQSPPSRRTTTR